jgi:muconate/chloromuconate cycloisomerase
MQIAQIEASIVQAEVTKPYVSALEKKGMTEVHCVVLRMTTDDGLCGLGETDPHPGFAAESPETVMQVIRRYLGPAVLGMDPGNLVALHTKMDSVVSGSPFAKAPIDIAAYDLLGQAWGVPVYQLLGGQVRDRVPMIWPIGGGTPEENVQEVVTKLEEGYRTLHVKLGALSPEEDIARIKAIRAAVGPDIFIMVDINQGWDRSTALRTIRQLEKFNLSIIEQPVPAWDIESMAKIQATVDTPISADEALHSTHQAVELIRRDAAHAFSLKNGKCGGLFRTRQIAAIIEAAGWPCFVNSMIEMGISVAASLHLAASVPNLIGHGHALMSNLRIKEDILVEDSFQYDDEDILVPQDCKGLGVKIDEEKLERRTLERFVLEI